MNQRGLVLEVKEEYAVVLTPSGEFCRIPRTAAMQVGQEVTFPVQSTLRALDGKVASQGRGAHRFAGRNRKWWSFGATAAVVLVAAGTWLGAGLGHPGTAEAYAWVSVDVNPSISLEVDKHLKVDVAQGTDADGVQLLSAVKIKGMTLSEATQAIVNYAASHNMIAENGAVLLSVSPIASDVNTEKVQAVAEQGAELAIKKSKTKFSAPPVYTVSVPKTIWQAAQKANISPGRLVSVLVSAEEGTPTGLSQAQGPTLAEIWSQPEAKKALNTLVQDDEKGLALALQNLAAQGYIGRGSVNEALQDNSQANPVSNHTDSPSENAASQNSVTPSNGQGKPDGNASQPPFAAMGGKSNHGQWANTNSSSRGNGSTSFATGNQTFNQGGNQLGNLLGNQTQNFAGSNSSGRSSSVQSPHNSVTIHVGNQSFTIPWQLPDGFKTPGKESSTSDDENPHAAQESSKSGLKADQKGSSSSPFGTTQPGATDPRNHGTNDETSGKWSADSKPSQNGHGWQSNAHGR